MTGIEPIAAVSAAVDASAPTPLQSGAPGAFANFMSQQVGDLNADVSAAETAMRRLASGAPIELHEVMISLEQARIGVQTFIQIRNKLIESYQDVMRMQM